MCDKQKSIKDNPYFIMELQTEYVILGWFQRFKGYTVFNSKEHGPELHNLEQSFKMKHLEEMSIVAEAISNIFKPDKMNYELLGNGCSHIHWHLYPRVKGDTPIVSSIYQLSNEELFDESTRPNEEQREELKEKIKNEIVHLCSK
jgi:diadenosine tetraphosphate (Ap4A) HIT family hydrolase